jgi:hypothetical protein
MNPDIYTEQSLHRPTFTKMRAKMIRLHMPNNTPARLIRIHMQRIQELAIIPQRRELLLRVGQRGLDAQVEEPAVDVGCWGAGEDGGEDAGDVVMHN